MTSWTPELLARLKYYIDYGGRTFEVQYQGRKVFGMDLVAPRLKLPPTYARIYLHEYDATAPPDGVILHTTRPADFAVYRLEAVDWQEGIASGRYRTTHCVNCGQPAVTWVGHVLKDGIKITAGRCQVCADRRHWGPGRPHSPPGHGRCDGPWRDSHGLEEDP